MNIGAPTTPVYSQYQLAQSGTDPADSTKIYKVYKRAFANALVVYKPLSYGNGQTGGLGSATATTLSLGGTYYQLKADGTINQTGITSITLQNGWGAILMTSPSGGGMGPLSVLSGSPPGGGSQPPLLAVPPTATHMPPASRWPLGVSTHGSKSAASGAGEDSTVWHRRPRESTGGTGRPAPGEWAALRAAVDALFSRPNAPPAAAFSAWAAGPLG